MAQHVRRHQGIRGSVSLVLLIVTAFALLGGYYWFYGRTICQRALSYEIGLFDDRFNITQEEFLTVVKNAERVWERDTGFDLLRYKSGSSFAINLIFDERQEEALALQNIESDIDRRNENIVSLQSQHQLLQEDYNRSIDAYERDVAHWNDQGGAPKEEFNALQEERRTLESMRLRLNSLARRINTYVTEHNLGVDEYNSRVGGEFTQGDYTGNAITIYQFDTRDELLLVLVHEFGHAFGLDHVQEDSSSVMYRLMRDQDLNSIHLTNEDIRLLRSFCGEI